MFPIRDHNPSLRRPYVTFGLIGLNLAIHLLVILSIPNERALGQLYYQFGMIPARLSDGQEYLTLISGTFLHAGWLHLAGNMLFLWIFGDNLEDRLGHVRFGLFYLAGGIGAGLVQWAAAPLSGVPTIGASGAIAGIMGGYLLLYPKARVDVLIIFIVFFKIFPIPAWIVLGVWFGLQLFSGIGDAASAGGVAYWEHIGGFVVGLGLILPVWLRAGGIASWTATHGQPPHPEARYSPSRIPVVPRRR